jgi:hypothetical protein
MCDGCIVSLELLDAGGGHDVVHSHGPVEPSAGQMSALGMEGNGINIALQESWNIGEMD